MTPEDYNLSTPNSTPEENTDAGSAPIGAHSAPVNHPKQAPEIGAHAESNAPSHEVHPNDETEAHAVLHAAPHEAHSTDAAENAVPAFLVEAAEAVQQAEQPQLNFDPLHATPANDDEYADSELNENIDSNENAAKPEDTADLIAAAEAAAAQNDAKQNDTDAAQDASEPSPGDTAEIDVTAVEAGLKDPGSTQSFEPLTGEERIDADSTYDAGTNTSLMWGARSDVGCVRSHNEDSYLVQSPLFCVCDGMGGHAAGEVASSIAVSTIAKTAPHEADPARLAAAVEAANAAIIEASINGLGKPGMGCTATCAYIEGSTVAIAHVGDSRAYLLHEGTLIRVTRDHSYVEELVDAGEITADEARVHPNRSVITRALGSDPAMYADHFSLNIEEGDRLILCSDGLSSMVPDGDIENIATQSSTAQICVDNLVDAALAAGGHDNVTVVVADVVDDGKLRKLSSKRRRNLTIMIAALAATLVLAAVITFVSVSSSVYLGAKDGYVAVYNGVPGSFMGIKLHSVEHKTTIKLSDLPEDTQSRLKQGIQQQDLDDANDTVSKYRKQIDQEQTKQVNDAKTIRENSGSDQSQDSNADSNANESSKGDKQ